MTPDTTPAVARAVELAGRMANADAAREITPRMLLGSLLAEEEGRAFQWLTQFGLNVVRWQAAQPAHQTAESSASSLIYSQIVRKGIQAATSLARSTSADGVVASEHLILGLLEADGGLTCELTDCGLEFDALARSFYSQFETPMPMDGSLELSNSREQIDTARILDAAANRAGEAMRVLEDFARFSLDDQFLCRLLKELRHELSAIMSELRPSELLVSRDTIADVGAAISTDSEQTRHSLADVVGANARRLQESLRSLEEFGKLSGPEIGQRFEKLRYRAYTLDRALQLGMVARDRLSHARLYLLLTGSTCRASLEWTIAEAAAGGVDIVQLREKSLPDSELLERARQVRRWTREAGVLFIVNDRPDIALLAEADGVHLGQDDLPVREARRVLGSSAIIGVSTHTIAQLRRAILDGAAYVGVGPTFPSTTKQFEELAGLGYVKAVADETSHPAFVLGGVTAENVHQLVAAGGKRVAVSAAIAQSANPRSAAMEIRAALK